MNEKNEPDPRQKIINRLALNRINIKDISDSDWKARAAIKEINEALIDFFESV